MADLRDKQEKFCIEYLIDLNATQAAIRSGYSEKTARQMGTENLSKPVIQQRIQELRLQASAESGVTPARVLKELEYIAFASSESITRGDGSMRLTMHDKLAALDKIGRHLGMFVDKHEVTGAQELVIRHILVGRQPAQ